jgi:NADPH2:quinone reductase
MTELTSRCYRLRRRPEGALAKADLEFVDEAVPSLQDGQALIRTLWLSVDPANRIWMSEGDYYLPPVELDAVMRGIGIGQVIDSRRADMAPGDLVNGLVGWTEYAIADQRTDLLPFTVLPADRPAPLTAFLGPLGHTGITAYLGVHDVGKPQPGQTMVVSAAAGAVGSVAGQIGKALGARVIGLAGSSEKCDYVVNRLGLDACINYKSPDWRDQLDAVTANGVDVDFENVGGPVLDHILTRLNVGARIALCGLMSEYNSYGAPGSPSNGHVHPDLAQILLANRAVMQSFLVLDHADRFAEATAYLTDLIARNRLNYTETIIDGLERTPDALSQMFNGSNTGKLLIRV